jgi:hypothetical protein
MKGKPIIILAVILFLFAPLAFSQSRDTGAISGKVLDDQNNPLPGATVTLTSEKIMGPRTQVTDASGLYRFQALPPGLYAVKAELPGFKSMIQADIRLTTTITLTVDLTLKQATVEEQVTVTAVSPTVDIKSTETASITLTNDVLRNIPYSQFTSDIVNMAPAVNQRVAYGAGSSRGISWQMDGVGVGDPDGGTAWVFLDHNIIEEAKVMGVGLPAEYGNFTGVIFNMVTKQGGNAFSGHIELDFQGRKTIPGQKGEFPGGSFWGTQNNADYVNDWPKITSPLEKLLDANFHLGGPIIKDKLWFYGGVQWYNSWTYPTGFPLAQDYKQPRAFFKLTSQLSRSTNMNASLEWDNYNGTYRGGSARVLPEATVNQEDPNWILNFSLTTILSPKTFIDFKAAGFSGYYNLNPRSGRDVAGHYFDDDAPDSVPGGGPGSGNKRHYSSGYFGEHDRTRGQINASLTHYAEDFIKGNHDFKFGVEFEGAKVRNKYGYTGQGPNGPGWYYEDYWGPSYYSYYYGSAYDYVGPYLATQYVGYEAKTRYIRLEAFVQDSWQITDRLNINLGLRFSQNWGTVAELSGVQYSAARLAPRVGFTFDILGDKSTIFKAHYGQFTDGMYTSILDRLGPNYSDKIYWAWDVVNKNWYETSRDVHGIWKMADHIKHPYMEQWTAGIERELFKDASFSITYINRSYHNFIGAFNQNAVYAKKTVSVPAPISKDYPVYDLIGGSDDPAWIITNMDDPAILAFYSALGITAKPYRNFWGLEFVFNKRFSNKWQLMVSYVYSHTKGTMDNTTYSDIGWGAAGYDPNFWTNADGNTSYDFTHQLKVQGSYVLPFGINFNAYFHGFTNGAWEIDYRTKRFSQGRITFKAEPRGSNHYGFDTTLDLRLEKTFQIAEKYRLGVMFDIFNVFNDNTITSWGTRLNYDYYPAVLDPTYSLSTQGHNLYGLVLPRRARVGIRLIF